jgi:L-alanine-DL-glutamate epimerase-like enolase superfamily enzyme
MKISKIELIPICRKIKGGMAQPRIVEQALEEQFAVLAKVYTDDGVVGVSEVAGENMQPMMDAIKEYISPILLNENPFNIDKIIHRIEDEVIGAYVPLADTYAESLLEFALYDIIGKKLNVPLYNILGGAYTKKFPMSWPLLFGKAEENAKEAADAYNFGFKCFKIKVGMGGWPPGVRDEERIRRIREAVGDDTVLSLDANERWSRSEAVRILKKLTKYDIAYVEQPVPRWDMEGMAWVRAKSEIPVAICESAGNIRDILEVIKKEAADILHLKIQRSGGIYRCKQIIGMVEAAGLAWTLSSMGGGALECAVNAHFAASTMRSPEPPFAFEIHGGIGLQLYREIFSGNKVKAENAVEDVAKKLPKMEDGYLYVPEGPGLGVELDEEKVKKLTVKDKSPIIVEM